MLGCGRWPKTRPGHFTPKEATVSTVQEAVWTLGTKWIGAKNPPPPGFKTRTVHLVASRYADWALPFARTTGITGALLNEGQPFWSRCSAGPRKLAFSQETCRFLANFITDSKHFFIIPTDAHNYKIIEILKQLKFRLSLRHVSVHAGTIIRKLFRA